MMKVEFSYFKTEGDNIDKINIDGKDLQEFLLGVIWA